MIDSSHAQRTTKRERPTCVNAGGALFVVLCGDRLAVKDAGGTSPKRQFEPGSPHQKWGRAVAAARPRIINPGIGPQGK